MPTNTLWKNLITKAANPHAKAGEVIAGNLVRGNDGKFSSGGGSAPAPGSPEDARQIQERLAQGSSGGKGGKKPKGGKGKAPKKSPEEKKTEAEKKKLENVGKLADKLLGSDLAELLTVGDTPGDLTGAKAEYGDQLVKKGLAKQEVDGSYSLTGAGKAMISAMGKGDEKRAKQAIAVGERQAALSNVRNNQRANQADARAQAAQQRADAIRARAEQSRSKVKETNLIRQRLGLSPQLETTKEAQTGIMVAFFLPPDKAAQLALPDPDAEKADQLHLTLAYLGDITEAQPQTKEAVQKLLSEFALGQTTPVAGKVSGLGLFNSDEGEGQQALHASFDSPALPDFRQELVHLLQDAGVTVATTHGFNPHITLKYVNLGTPLSGFDAPQMDIVFDTVTLAWGDERTDFPLGSSSATTATDANPDAYYNSKEVSSASAVPLHGPGGLMTAPGLSSSVMNAQLAAPKKRKANSTDTPSGLSTGDCVAWSSSRGVARGKIVSIHKSSTVPNTPVKVSGSQVSPAARIELFRRDEAGSWQPTGEYVAHRLDSLKKISQFKERQSESNFLVIKQADGKYRWLTFSSSGFQDRDGETVSTKALADDCTRADGDGEYGTLNWWHVPGTDIGDCDYNAMCGRVLIESGTFRNNTVAQRIKQHAPDLGVSLEFLHPINQPDQDGIYWQIRRKRRSLLPTHVASNRLTGLIITNNKGTQEMSMLETKMRDLWKKLGGDKQAETLVTEIVSAAGEAEKSALAQALTFKAAGEDPETTDPAMLGEGSPAEEAAETPEEETVELAEGEGDVLDMTRQELYSMVDSLLASAIATSLEPVKAQIQKMVDKISTTKEVDALSGIADVLGETTATLKSIQSANTEALQRIKVLEDQNAKLVKRVKELRGELPPAVAAGAGRSSQNGAVLPAGHPLAAQAEKQSTDPDDVAIANVVTRILSGGLS